MLKFKPFKFSLYESRLSRILTKHHSRTTTAMSPLELLGPRGSARVPVLLKGTHGPREGGRKTKMWHSQWITSCNELPAVFVLLREGKSGVRQSRWEVLSRHSPACVHKHPFSLSKLQQPHTARVSQDPGHSPPCPSLTPSHGPTASCSPHMPG